MQSSAGSSGEGSGFTGPIGIIDVGSHFTRLEITQIADGAIGASIESIARPIALGQDVFTAGKISSQSISKLVETLRQFKRSLADYGVSRVRAVATSAAREAENSLIFLDKIRRETGISVEILEAPVEAKIIFLGIREAIGSKFDFAEQTYLLCDITSGSMHLGLVEKGLFTMSDSVNNGSVRMIEEINCPSDRRRLISTLVPFIKTSLRGILSHAGNSQISGLILAGGSARIIAEIAAKLKGDNSAGEAGEWLMPRDDFKKVFAALEESVPSEIAVKFGISDFQAVGLLPSCIIVSQLLSVVASDKIIVPPVSTRDALILDCLRSGSPGDFENDLIACAIKIGERYGFDKVHSNAVMAAAEGIFSALAPVHGLGGKELTYLRIAALLHDVGLYVSPRLHHKHSCYLIRNTQIPGFTEEERGLVAAVARYHRRSFPKSSHPEFTDLSPESRIIVEKLSSILRLADSLDFIGEWASLNFKLDGKAGLFYVEVGCPIDSVLSDWALNTKANMLENVYGLDVVLKGKG